MQHQNESTTSFLCIELLNSFTKKELQKFNQFINSPYFNADIRLIKLFGALRKEVLNKPFTDQQQAKVYKKIFETKLVKELSKSEKKVLRTKLSKLNKLAQQFLVIESLGENQNAYNDHLFNCLLDKRNFNAFHTLLKRDKKRLALKQRKETADFEHLYKVEMHFLEYLFLSGFLYKKNQFEFKDVVCKLDIQYLLKKLSLFNTILSNKLVINNQSIDYSTMTITNDLLKLPQYNSQPYLTLLSATNNFLQEFSTKTYHNILHLLNAHGSSIPLADLKGIYIVILNFLYREIKKGNLDYEKDLIKLYISMDNRNLLLEENIMSTPKLKNVVIRMCKSSYFDKALFFIKKYIPFIRKNDQQSIENICLAYVYFYQQDYNNALEHIIKVGNVNVNIEFDHRILMMKIYYEIDKTYSEKTERFYRSADKFFSDNKLLSRETKKAGKNFIKMLLNLYRLKHEEGKMTVPKLQNKLKQYEFMASKKWLLEKMEELKK